ncbi:MAG TPA: hypothetical protein VD866_28095 [Urbifossiella sp.]|nr:hypothetical protein [Urbifossiella sp.]
MLFDFSGRLRENPQLLSLLGHYAQLAAPDPPAWQDRVMELDGADPREVTALHGELIAFDWVEQNAGHVRVRPDGSLAECYRVTTQGLREFRRITGQEVTDEPPEPPAKAPPGPPRRKKANAEPQPSSPA